MENKQPFLFKYRIIWHILFWICIYFAYVISYGGYGNGNYSYEAIINAILLPVRMAFTYTMIYLLLPHFLMKRKYRNFFLFTAVHAFLFGFSIWLMYYYVIEIEGYVMHGNDYPIFYFPKIFVSIISNYGIPLLAVIVKIFKWWYTDQQYKMQLEREKLSSEIKYLKAQIHPHFLFNTLNNLYALTLKQSKKAADVVIKLSNILDYMLYHSGNERVLLEKELNILNSYIELEKIRYGDRLDLEYKVNGEPSAFEVAPLILFPFVENAFKHGASNDSATPSISILIVIKREKLMLTVKNSLPPGKVPEIDNSNGIGMKNIRRQLSLLYPEQHNLKVDIGKDFFLAELTIYWKKSEL